MKSIKFLLAWCAAGFIFALTALYIAFVFRVGLSVYFMTAALICVGIGCFGSIRKREGD